MNLKGKGEYPFIYVKLTDSVPSEENGQPTNTTYLIVLMISLRLKRNNQMASA